MQSPFYIGEETDDIVALNEQDRAWIRETIQTAHKAHGWSKFTRFIKDWSGTSAAVAIILFVATQWTGYVEFRTQTNGRLTEIEKQLTRLNLATSASLSPGSFASNLQQLGTDIRQAQEKKVDITGGILNDLQQKLIGTDSGAQGYWPTAVQLVDYKYRASASVSKPRNCLDTVSPDAPEVDRLTTNTGVVDYPSFSGPQTPGWMAHLMLGNCNLNLDDNGDFYSTSAGKFFQRVKEHHPQASLFFLVLNNAHITYSGGKMLPVSGIQFTNCTFEFKPPTGIPSKLTQSITTQLLAANAYQGTIQLQTGL